MYGMISDAYDYVLVTGASAGVVAASNGMTTEQWKVGRGNAQPQVYLSAFEMVINFLTLFALAEGMVIRYWRQLLHGTTVSIPFNPIHNPRLIVQHAYN
jgi:hypothetical protein